MRKSFPSVRSKYWIDRASAQVRNERLPKAVPGIQLYQGIVKLVGALAADAIGCSHSRGFAALANHRQG
jgi:hypothetical protein